ncbi:MAG: histidinol-phosphatase HisJ family protein [Acidimicrobiia bacterium]|nr:histidinol-phosphatase HisJ family protein [Acidimicrobiia bacterium]MDQ3501369.1 histidinol-phosphatase HisJ family protein [Actinomycetota bacterium]
MSDYHLHLHPHGRDFEWPPHGEYPDGLIESYVDVAAGRGAFELGFTEHLYRTDEGLAVLGRFWEDEPNPELRRHCELMVANDSGLSLARYVEAISAAKERGLPVKLGLEVDFFADSIDAVMELLAPIPFDFLIGSVHWIGGWSLDSSSVSHEFERRGIDQAWEEYFELVEDLARRGVVDVLAHVDVCKKLGFRPISEPIHLYQKVVDAAAASGMAVEVSSQGIRMPVGEAYPSPRFLAMFQQASVPITFASDAHRPADSAFAFGELQALARQAGYTSYLRYTARRPETVLLT